MEIKELSDSEQWGGWRGIMRERSGRCKLRNTNRGLMSTDNGGGLTVRVGHGGREESNGEKGEQL